MTNAKLLIRLLSAADLRMYTPDDTYMYRHGCYTRRKQQTPGIATNAIKRGTLKSNNPTVNCRYVHCYKSESTKAQRPAGSVCAHAGDGRPYLAQGSSMQYNRRKSTQCSCETVESEEKE